MNKNQENVKKFMQFFNQNCPDKPTQLDEETAKLRAALILEECLEIITKGLGLSINIWDEIRQEQISISEQNIKNYFEVKFTKVKEVNLVELADGLADLDYVATSGTANAAGIDIQPVIDEVHKSNMSKSWKEEELDEAKKLYPDAKVENYGKGLYRLIREDGKIIKSPSYKKADVESIIKKQSGIH